MLWDDIGKNELGSVRGVGVCFVKTSPANYKAREVATYLRHRHSGHPHSVYEFTPNEARAFAVLLKLAADLADQRT